jgi:lipid-binding SYLF domain-containing protein
MKEIAMFRRNLLLAAGAAFVAGCTTTTGSPDPAARRREIDVSVDSAIAQLFSQVPGSREMASNARGVLVLPKVISAGLGVGGTYGEGALRKGGTSTSYYSMGGASVGLIAGGQSRAVYLLFMTPEALAKLESSKGWTAGVDASVAFLSGGADAQATTRTAQQQIVGYVLTNAGLMANVSFDGTKFTRLEI